MPIAFSSSVDNGTTSGFPATVTYAFNVVSSDANTCLIVHLNTFNHTSYDITGVTYNAAAMTKIDHAFATNGNKIHTALYFIMNPDTGNNNIVISTGSNNEFINSKAALYTDVDDVAPIDSSSAVNGNSGTASTTLSPTAEQAWLITAVGAAQNVTASTNVTDRESNANNGLGDSNGGVATAGNPHTVAWTLSSSGLWALMAAALKPSPVTISVTDGIKIGDSEVSAIKTFFINVTDGLKLGESVTIVRQCIVNITDGIKIGDVVSKFSTIWSRVAKSVTSWTEEDK